MISRAVPWLALLSPTCSPRFVPDHPAQAPLGEPRPTAAFGGGLGLDWWPTLSCSSSSVRRWCRSVFRQHPGTTVRRSISGGRRTDHPRGTPTLVRASPPGTPGSGAAHSCHDRDLHRLESLSRRVSVVITRAPPVKTALNSHQSHQSGPLHSIEITRTSRSPSSVLKNAHFGLRWLFR